MWIIAGTIMQTRWLTLEPWPWHPSSYLRRVEHVPGKKTKGN